MTHSFGRSHVCHIPYGNLPQFLHTNPNVTFVNKGNANMVTINQLMLLHIYEVIQHLFKNAW